MHLVDEGSSNQAQDIHDFNRELQWTLVKMKKDNDELTDSLQYLIDGGDKEQVIDLLKQKDINLSPPHSPSNMLQYDEFRTPNANTINYDEIDQDAHS